jgi:hypothetical protein
MAMANPNPPEPPKSRRKLLIQAVMAGFLVLVFIGGLLLLSYSVGEEESEPMAEETMAPGSPIQ